MIDLAVNLGVKPESFYIPMHRTIYEQMIAMLQSSRVIDLSTLTDFCRTSDKLNEIGGYSELQKLIDATPTSENAEYYAKIVLEKQLLRSIIASSRDIEGLAYRSDNAEDLRSKAEFDFGQLRQEKTQADTADSAITRQFESWETAQRTGCAGIPTGFEIIDKCFGGLMPASLMIFSGKAGACKTTLARNITENVGMRGIPVSYASLEQTSDQLWGSIVAREAKQSVFLLNCGSKAINWPKMIAARAVVSKWPIWVDDRPKTPTQLWSWARYEINKHGSKLLVLDYLQALTPDEKYKSDESRITAYSSTCRAIAKDLRVCFIVISALSNEGNLRGSGMISYDAWGHIKMSKADDWKMPDNLHYLADIEKQRFGPEVSGRDLWLIGNEQRLEEKQDVVEEERTDRTQVIEQEDEF